MNRQSEREARGTRLCRREKVKSHPNRYGRQRSRDSSVQFTVFRVDVYRPQVFRRFMTAELALVNGTQVKLLSCEMDSCNRERGRYSQFGFDLLHSRFRFHEVSTS